MASAPQFGPFDAGPLTIEERFAEQGRKRQDIVWNTYVQQDVVAAPFFDKDRLDRQELGQQFPEDVQFHSCIWFTVDSILVQLVKQIKRS